MKKALYLSFNYAKPPVSHTFLSDLKIAAITQMWVVGFFFCSFKNKMSANLQCYTVLI